MTDTIRHLLAERVGRESLGYVAGTTGAKGAAIVTAGLSGAADGGALDGDSVFEIGSLTKVFTALLLADMVARDEVALADPVAAYLPPEGRPRPANGKPITLLDLATNTSGLPRLPANLRPQDPANPYADYTVDQFYAALSSWMPTVVPGSRCEYSNLGFGLLGHVLAARAGGSYEDLVVSRLCDPLGLDDTRITLTAGMRVRLVPGHDAGLVRVPGWDMPTLAGAGALRSTADDLLRFLDACTGRQPGPLSAALSSLTEIWRPSDMPNVTSAMGWSVLDLPGDEIAWKNGGTYGYSSFVGYSTRTGAAAVLLANSFNLTTTTQLGLHVIDPRIPLPPSLP